MRFWVREIAGWALVLLSLLIFYICYDLLVSPAHAVIETGSLTIIGIILFRGGIHLLKVAVAARICTEAQQRVPAARTSALRRP
jgi:hypothetical protein